jgi:hypothetical protein
MEETDEDVDVDVEGDGEWILSFVLWLSRYFFSSRACSPRILRPQPMITYVCVCANSP